MLRAVGMGDADWEKPQVGIASSWNEITPCNLSLDRLAQAAKEGVHAGGGYPLQFGTISVSDGISMGHEGMHFSLVSREVIADSVEVVMQAERLDGSVLLNLHAGDDVVFTSAIWTMDSTRGTIGFNADPKDPSVAVSRQMTVMMPLMIGFFSLQVPSGMAVYWIVGNLFGIGQYTAMGRANFRNLFGRPAPAVVTNAVSKAKAQINGGSSRPAINVPTLRKTDAANSSNGSTSTSQSNSVTPAKPKAKAKARAK